MASKTLVGETHSIRGARQFVEELLDGSGVDMHIATLLTSELATNVVEHARTDLDVVVTIDDTLVRVEIHDGMTVSEAFRDLIHNPPIDVALTSPHGRGLLLVRSSAQRFGLTDKGLAGKAIWFELERQPDDRPAASPPI